MSECNSVPNDIIGTQVRELLEKQIRSQELLAEESELNIELLESVETIQMMLALSELAQINNALYRNMDFLIDGSVTNDADIADKSVELFADCSDYTVELILEAMQRFNNEKC